MIIEAARRAAKDVFASEFRPVLWKSLGLTLLLFIGGWIALESVVSTFLLPFLGPWPWVSTAIVWLLGAGMFVGAGFLLAPVTAIFAGLFLDDISHSVEQKHYPDDPAGQPVPIFQSLMLALKFTFVVVGANLIALLLVLLPGINVAIFFLVNGYLLGREYFTFVAMRFMPEADANRLRKRNSSIVLIAGLVIAGFMAVPILNLLTPIFATALMVHIKKGLTQAPLDSEPNQHRVAA